jgi:hypothetical protein
MLGVFLPGHGKVELDNVRIFLACYIAITGLCIPHMLSQAMLSFRIMMLQPL